ncbi:MAG: D-2-hydroxyacid dehydrogenase [Mogibacterium sp.]|nr:D-2-hydroxyacid dehydrogenase [Mogibacterium sp.]
MEEKLICVVINFMNDKRAAMIREAAARCGYNVEIYDSVEAAGDRLGQCEVLYCGTADVAAHAKSAKWISSSWAGIAPFLAPGVLPEGCLFTKGAGSYGVTISEHVIAVTLMLLKRFPEYFADLADHKWTGGRTVWSILGSHVTIIGTGNIGQTIAARMRAFGAERIAGVNYQGKNPDRLFDEIYTFDRVDEALPGTDILVCCAPDTAETRGMITGERIAMLGPHSVLVNVGRGTILDQDALVEALNNKVILGASIDVTVPEPLPFDHPLWTARNCIITPHVSGNMTLEYTGDESVRIFCANLGRYVKGEPLEHMVDFTKGY